ncbi:low molecular weight phosphatase family protein [Aureispira anguillae]|uniref:Protein-tyrosine-phosphatase n=1 Tax=Aureispira anguillae TaxID=2864201 RepID=A0A915YG45_9BACT|nr:protein-tyrosine-phosphatase [Aureispira anguillae]BDS12527.1 protein-tyrosine-phosphatase [Aureispira anguillae]
MQKNLLNTALIDYCQQLEQGFEQLPATRKAILLQLSNYLSQKINAKQVPQVTVICTHNSRRSHFGQLWLAIGATYYGLPPIRTFSGGTEVSAFNPRAVQAFQRIGLEIKRPDHDTANPAYEVRWQVNQSPYIAFSKKHTTAPNPSSAFAAVMVCTDADQNCPLVAGTDLKLTVPYTDPKKYDDTNLEAIEYDKTCQEIGREMLFVLQQTQQLIK